MISIAIVPMVSIESVNAQTVDEFINSSIPQVVERIDGNMVTFKGKDVESQNYYVPSWMVAKYNLKVGSSVYLYNQNVIQGTYRGTYIERIGDTLINTRAFALSPNLNRNYAALGQRVWYQAECCLSTVPVVGAMWNYQTSQAVSVEQSQTITRTRTTVMPQTKPEAESQIAPTPVNFEPVQGLW